MAFSIHALRLSLTAAALFWFSAFLLEKCEATTVSLTGGPYSSHSRRYGFGLSRSQKDSMHSSAALLDGYVENDYYKKVEDCGVRFFSRQNIPVLLQSITYCSQQ
ncbi:MAG: hypothetical protein ACI8RD_001264 [Bacillariaceae sp.]|jgi:hypothetical protein